MNTARKLLATALGAATVGILALPASTASAVPVQAGFASHDRDGDRGDRGFSTRDRDRRDRLVSYWTIVRADDEDGRVVANLREGQWAKVSAVRAWTDCNTEDDSDACRHGRDGADALAPADWLAPGLRQFSLVGAVGGGDFVQLGSERTKMTGTGPVALAYNDLIGGYDDNRGGFLVRVTKCRWAC
jgi:hypothetical protein